MTKTVSNRMTAEVACAFIVVWKILEIQSVALKFEQ
jgi:hypothetical protein